MVCCAKTLPVTTSPRGRAGLRRGPVPILAEQERKPQAGSLPVSFTSSARHRRALELCDPQCLLDAITSTDTWPRLVAERSIPKNAAGAYGFTAPYEVLPNPKSI